MRGKIAASAVALCSVGFAIYVHQGFVRKELLLIYQWEMLVANWLSAGSRSLVPPGDRYVFSIYLWTFLEFAAIVVVGLVALAAPIKPKSDDASLAMRILAGCGLLALAVGLGVVYAEILNRPDWPAEHFPERNRREEFRSIVARHELVNPQSWSIDDLRTAKNDSAASTTASLFQELDEVLAGDEITCFDSRTDDAKAEFRWVMEGVMSTRGVGRAIHAQAKADWAAGRRQSAIDHDRLNLLMAEAMQRRSIGIEALIGMAIEGSATHHLNEIRTSLTCEEITPLLATLKQVGETRESLDLLVQRDEVFTEESGGWRERLEAAVRRLRGVPNSLAQGLGDACKRRDATLSLLQADLAIRCYREKFGRLPDDLSALTPEFLDVLPIDPYNEKPLIYQAQDDGFLLYSVGPDGDDDSGKFGTFSELYQRPNEFDLDLDAFVRPTS